LNHVAEQRKITARSVFFVGEIGVNDYFLAIMSKSLDVAESLVPPHHRHHPFRPDRNYSTQPHRHPIDH